MTEPLATVGRYRIERLIAHGGMGSLYLARDPAIDRLLVIKLLREGFDDDAARERFTREARAAGRLQHRNIVTVFDIGEHQERPFIAMEYVAGETLAQLIRRRAISRLWQKLAILEDLCVGLHYAHAAGIIHRDIKPANVMRDESGVTKILDFGVARTGGTGLTRAGDIVGTLNYMSPEQLAGEQVDHRSDVYSVGALAYELVTNQMAFPGTIHTGVLSQILNSAPLPVERLVPGIDPDVAAMIERAMARDLDVRYQDLEELGRDLAAVRERLHQAASELEETSDPDAETLVSASPVGSGTQPRPASRAGSRVDHGSRAVASTPAMQLSPARQARRFLLLGVASAALIVAVIAAVMFNRGRISNSPAQTASTVQPRETDQASARPVPTPPTPPDVRTGQSEKQLRDAQVNARRQIAAGQPQSALDTATTGLALDAKDADLNSLVEELARVARQTATESRELASRRGASPDASTEYREGQARQRDAESHFRAGDRVAGIRALWAAAALYSKARGARERNASAAPAPVSTPPVEPIESLPSKLPSDAGSRPFAVAPSPATLKPAPVQTDKPLATVDAERKVEPTTAADPLPDSRAAEAAAIRDTLRRYTDAYQSLDSAAVGKMMPSLTGEQLRSLERDFSNYRSYKVEIRDERIAVSGPTATVTCQVVRSFETKTGVAGSNTVQSIFHLRANGPTWTIERVESR